MNINKDTVKLYLKLRSSMAEKFLYREVLGMTEQEAEGCYRETAEEAVEREQSVMALYVQRKRQDTRARLGFKARKEDDEVQPMPPSMMSRLMGMPDQPQQDEEEI